MCVLVPSTQSCQPSHHRHTNSYLGEQGENSHIDGAVLVSPGFDMEVRLFVPIVGVCGWGKEGWEKFVCFHR